MTSNKPPPVSRSPLPRRVLLPLLSAQQRPSLPFATDQDPAVLLVLLLTSPSAATAPISDRYVFQRMPTNHLYSSLGLRSLVLCGMRTSRLNRTSRTSLFSPKNILNALTRAYWKPQGLMKVGCGQCAILHGPAKDRSNPPGYSPCRYQVPFDALRGFA